MRKITLLVIAMVLIVISITLLTREKKEIHPAYTDCDGTIIYSYHGAVCTDLSGYNKE